MDGLRATRVIVIDDEVKDGLAVLRALAKMSIPAAYFREPDDAPPEENRLTGVRLAFLDMDVIGASTDRKNMMSALVNLVRKILSPENGPYLIIAWTKHTDYVTEFTNFFFTIPDIPKPIEIVTIAKAECRLPNAEGEEQDFEYDLSRVAIEVDRALASFSPLRFLQVWEEQCFKAANAVTTELSKLAIPDESDPQRWRERWKAQMLGLIHAMAEAAAGQHNLADGDSVVTSFCSSLNPLHADRLERITSELCTMLADCSREVLRPELRVESTQQVRAQINSMLQLAFEGVDKLYAGNIYSCANGTPLADLIPDVDGLIESFIKGTPPDPQDKDKKRVTAWNEKKTSVSNSVMPVVIEINTLCDHSQNNIKLARLIAGVLAPTELLNQTRDKADWMWKFGPVHLTPEGRTPSEYYLFLNSRFLISSSLATLKDIPAMMRLRGQAFAVLQAWFGSHSSRPGMLLLTDK